MKKDYLKARGVGLKQSEWGELQRVADELEMNLHSVSAYALRYFIDKYKSGKIKVEKKRVAVLPKIG